MSTVTKLLADRRVLCLDLGGTLIRARGNIGALYAARAAALSIPVTLDADTLQRRFVQSFRRLQLDARARGLLAYGRTEQEARDFWHQVVGEVFALESMAPECFARLFDDLYAYFARAEAWEVFADVPPLLQRARQAGIKIAIVSNWDARLATLVKVLHLQEQVDVVVGSYAVGAEKPAPALFAEALRRLGESANPRRVLHIGDTYEEDVLGARHAGLDALHLDRSGILPVSADRISSLDVLQ